MSQVMMDRKACTLVAINTNLTKSILGFDILPFVKHLEAALDVDIFYWSRVDFVAQDICDFADKVKQRQRQHEHGRTLLLGADLENQVTAIALRFLAEGLETYLLKDLMCSSDNKFEAVHEMRLFSVGAIPTTMSQVLMEWIAFETDLECKNKIVETLNRYRQLLS
jgi:hypothetical protein